MSLTDIIKKYWSEDLPDNVIFMAVYRLERDRKYPNIPFRYFNPITMDWYFFKKWMEKEEAHQARIIHNERIAKEYKGEAPEGE